MKTVQQQKQTDWDRVRFRSVICKCKDNACLVHCPRKQCDSTREPGKQLCSLCAEELDQLGEAIADK